MYSMVVIHVTLVHVVAVICMACIFFAGWYSEKKSNMASQMTCVLHIASDNSGEIKQFNDKSPGLKSSLLLQTEGIKLQTPGIKIF